MITDKKVGLFCLNFMLIVSCLVTTLTLWTSMTGQYWLVSEKTHEGILQSCSFRSGKCKVRDGPGVFCAMCNGLAVFLATLAFVLSLFAMFKSYDDYIAAGVISISSPFYWIFNMYAVHLFEDFAEERFKRTDEFWYGRSYDYARRGTMWSFISFIISVFIIFLSPTSPPSIPPLKSNSIHRTSQPTTVNHIIPGDVLENYEYKRITYSKRRLQQQRR